MNTGLQDAANLGWKLTAVLRDGAPDSLLDTYHDERHPVGRMVLRSSGAILRLAMASGPAGLGARRLAALAVGRIRPVGRRALGNVTGIGVAYRAGRGAHVLTGRRAPDLRLAAPPGAAAGTDAPARLHEALRGGRFVLVAPADGPGQAGPREAPAGYGSRVRPVHWAGDRRTTLLVRPDGYVAWASDAPSPSGLRTALHRWAGPPSPPGPGS